MKQIFSFFITFLVIIFLVISSDVKAQEYDYLDVTPGYETLNLAISGDTTATGEPVSANRVYRLKRGDAYLLNGTVTNIKGNILRIFAEEGDGARPMIMATADESGASYRAFAPEADAYFKNLYISGRNNLGIYTDDSKDMIRLQESGITVEVDGCFLEHEWKDFFRMNASDQSVIVKNSILRNGGDLADGSDNQFIDTRSKNQKLISFQNSTLHTSTGRGSRSGGGSPYQEFFMDHCTIYQVGNGDGARGAVDTAETPLFSVERVAKVTVTNNIFMDVVFHGDEINTYASGTLGDSLAAADTLDYPIFGFLPLDNAEIPEETREIVLRNNVHGTTQALLDYYATVDTVKPPVLLNAYSLGLINLYSENWKQEGNFSESIVFTDAPSPDPVVVYTKFRRDNDFLEENVPEFWADRNGIGETPDTWGPAVNEYDFSYNTSAIAYTAGDDGFPLGDLNWFPTKKAEWLVTDVEETNSSLQIPIEYKLTQNYPNPFNPTTNIEFSLPGNGMVSLKVFDVLGQEVAELVNKEMKAGSYKFNFEATHLTTGIYFYTLSSEGFVQTKKMLLLK